MHIFDLLDPAASVTVAALVNGLWQGLVLLGLVWGLLRIVELRRRLNATTRYAVWSVTLAAVLCLPVGVGLMAATSPDAPSKPAYAEAVVVLPEEAAAPMLVVEDIEDPALEEAEVVAPVEEVAALPEEIALAGQAFRPSPWRMTLPPGRWMLFVFGAWVLVALALLARVARGCVYVWRLKRHSTPLPPAFQQRLDAWRRVYGLRRPVRIAGMEGVATPVAVGLWQPMILVPVSLLDQLTEEEFDQVMLHELAHVERRDDWTNLFQKLAEALLFFHPAVHWMGRQMEREREMACDDWVVSLTRRPRSYASCLARLVELNVRSRVMLVAPGMAVGKAHLFERVRRLLDQRRPVTAHLSRAGFLTVVLTLVAAFLLVAYLGPLFTSPESDEVVVEELTVHPIIVEASKPRLLHVVEPGVVVALEPLAEPVVEVVLEPVVQPLGAIIITSMQPDTIVHYRPLPPIRDNSLRGVAAINDTRQTLEIAEPALRQTSRQPQDLSVTSWIRVLKAAARIASSGDQARFLIEAVRRMPENESVYAAFLETAKTVDSSGDRKRALSTLLAQHRLGASSMVLFLEAVQGLTSSGDRTRLLIKAAPVLPDDEAAHTAYLETAESLTSSADYRRVLAALTKAQR